MRVNTIPLLPHYNNTRCTRFWDGYFHFSNTVWVVIHAKGKEIEAIEIKNPHTRGLNALKIFLLFTAIVPLIAAIYHLVKISHFKHYNITLVKPYLGVPFPHKPIETLEPPQQKDPIPTAPFNDKETLSQLSVDEIVEILIKNPNKQIPEIIEKLGSDELIQKVFIGFISSKEIFKAPDTYLAGSLDILRQISTLDGERSTLPEIFLNNLQKLLSHKDVQPNTRLKFIQSFSDTRIVNEMILEFLKDEQNFLEFKIECIKPSSDEIFKTSAWSKRQRDWRPYLLFIECLHFAEDISTLDKLSFLFTARPDDIDISQFKDDYIYKTLLVTECYYQMQQADLLKIRELVLEISKRDAMDLVCVLFPLNQMRALYLMMDKEDIAICLKFIKAILDFDTPDEEAIQVILDAYFSRLYKHSSAEIDSSIHQFLHYFDTEKKLDVALDCIQRLPEEKKNALLHVFLGGIIVKEGVNKLVLTVNLREDLIHKALLSKGLEFSFKTPILLENLFNEFW